MVRKYLPGVPVTVPNIAEPPLRVGAAFPDPPFNDTDGSGLDIELMGAIGHCPGRRVEFIRYEDRDRQRDFEGIFDALDSGEFDCVASGTTVTASRALKAAFCDPYLISSWSPRCPGVEVVQCGIGTEKIAVAVATPTPPSSAASMWRSLNWK